MGSLAESLDLPWIHPCRGHVLSVSGSHPWETTAILPEDDAVRGNSLQINVPTRNLSAYQPKAQSTQDASTNWNVFPLMLFGCSVDTPIHINRSHLLALHCASGPASCVDWAQGARRGHINRPFCSAPLNRGSWSPLPRVCNEGASPSWSTFCLGPDDLPRFPNSQMPKIAFGVQISTFPNARRILF